MPLPSRTLTEETSAATGPYATWDRPSAIWVSETGSVTGAVKAGAELVDPSGPKAGPETMTNCWPRPAPPAPGLPAVSFQRWPLTVPDAISPGGECGPGGCTVAV